MVLQNLEVVPKELYVQFDKIPYLVRPNIEYDSSFHFQMPVLAGKDYLNQLYTPDVFSICQQLDVAAQDAYSSLSKSQPLVKANKVSKNAMVYILQEFGNQIF